MHLVSSTASSHHRPSKKFSTAFENATFKALMLCALIAIALIFIFVEISVVYESASSKKSSNILDHADLHLPHVSSAFHDKNENENKNNDKNNNNQEAVSSPSLASLLSERQKLIEENVALKSKVERMVKLQQQIAQIQEPVRENEDEKNSGEKRGHVVNNNNNNLPQQKPWLIIGIPTVPRESSHKEPSRPQLLRTLDSLKKQIHDPTFMNRNVIGANGEEELSAPSLLVKVVVMNQDPGGHPVFELAKNEFSRKKKSSVKSDGDDSNWWIEFVENDQPYHNPPYEKAKIVEQEFQAKNQERPIDSVKKQTLDVSALLNHVEGKSTYFFFYEDDFHFCDNALLSLMNVIERANLYYGMNSWSAIRCSFGLAGIVMQNGKLKLEENEGDLNRKNTPEALLGLPPQPDLTVSTFHSVTVSPHPDVAMLKRYFLRHFIRRPPDHLVVEFYAKESHFARSYFGKQRNVAGYRYNILRHDGIKSTLRQNDGWSMPGCFEELVVPQVFAVEAWDPKQCPDSDLWPCDYEHRQEKQMMNDDRRNENKGFRSLVGGSGSENKIEKRLA